MVHCVHKVFVVFLSRTISVLMFFLALSPCFIVMHCWTFFSLSQALADFNCTVCMYYVQTNKRVS